MSNWPGGGEEFNLERLSGNPRMCEVVEDFLTRQRKFVAQIKWPPGTKFECKGCGDCCKWYFLILITGEKLVEKLRGRAKYPHGFWHLREEGRIEVRMPNFYFIGLCPPAQAEFLTVTSRTWGYWVLNARGKVVLYNPVPCIHLAEENQCAIYEEEQGGPRPRVCQMYYCRRWPIIVQENKIDSG